MSSSNIKTLIFDLGGVYFTAGSVLAIKKIREIYDITDDQILVRFFGDIPNTEGNMIRRGQLTMEEFENRFVESLDLPSEDRHHARYIWFESYVPHYGMAEIVKKLREKGFRLIIFSGNIRERIDFLDEKYKFKVLFDEFVFSFDYNLNKDHIDFYKELINHIECKPNEAVLIDDEKKNLRLAKSLGFNSIHYYYTTLLKEQLKKYNIFL